MEKKNKRNWVVMLDGYSTLMVFDDTNGGGTEAERYLSYCKRNFQGSFSLKSMSDKELRHIYTSTTKHGE